MNVYQFVFLVKTPVDWIGSRLGHAQIPTSVVKTNFVKVTTTGVSTMDFAYLARDMPTCSDAQTIWETRGQRTAKEYAEVLK